jgi:polyisoprenoid-binding protein YceI
MNWKVDELHSSIHFSVRHLVVAKLHGQFRRYRAELAMDDLDLTRSSVAITIEADSIDTGNAERDASLRSERFFDVEKFPTLSYRSRRVERSGENDYRIVGDLTLRNVTKEVVLDVEHGGFVTDLRGVRRSGFTARGNIQRSEFGMVWNQVLDAGGVAVGDRVDLHLEIETVALVAKVA